MRPVFDRQSGMRGITLAHTSRNPSYAKPNTAVWMVRNMLRVHKENGGGWHLTRTWAGGRLKERALKMQSGARYCPEPECSGEHPRAGDEMPDPVVVPGSRPAKSGQR